MQWWENLSDEQIEQLKTNCVPYGLLPEYTRKLFGPIDYTLVQFYAQSSWHQMYKHETFNSGFAYRLNPSWQRPEKKGHWEYCEIEKNVNFIHFRWRFEKNHYKVSLGEAFSMVGFGGFEFEEWPGLWYNYLAMKDSDGRPSSNSENFEDTKRPATPIRVRFWVE